MRGIDLGRLRLPMTLCLDALQRAMLRRSVLRSVRKVELTAANNRPFANASTLSLMRAGFVFALSATDFAITTGPKLLKHSEKIFGRYLTYNTFVKWTIFDHFCGGVDEKNLKPTLDLLASKNIGPILDYAAEGDMAESPSQDAPLLVKDLQEALKMSVVLGDDVKSYDVTAALFHDCMRHAGTNLPPGGGGVAYSAIKVSGLCNPQLLIRISAVLLSIRRLWVGLFTELPPIETCRVVLDWHKSAKPQISTAGFVEGIVRLGGGKISPDAVKNFSTYLDPKGTGSIDYLDFTQRVADLVLSLQPPPSSAASALSLLPSLTSKELHDFQQFKDRLNLIVEQAKMLNVRVLVDAEQSYMQMAIDHVVRDLQREHNQHHPLVYNTYQCYLTYTMLRLENDLNRAQREGWMWAGKMVRGAYIKEETALSEQYHYDSLIHPSKTATHRCYDDCATRILGLIADTSSKPVGVLFGSHNVDSMQLIADAVFKLDGTKHKAEICFAQLYGMGDHITLPLAEAGYKVFKYVPYGPVHETMKYLLRRAVENHDMLLNASSERGKIWLELQSRPAFWCIVAAATLLVVFVFRMFLFRSK